MLNSKVLYSQQLPPHSKFPKNSLVLFDKIFLNHPATQKWIRNFASAVPLTSGERIKSLQAFHQVINKVHKDAQKWPKNSITLISMGGGSIGDLAGFVASVYKRGVNLIHIPTTWLSAIDSAHGGKNALNLSDIKNQLGTIYPASKVYIVKNLLFLQSKEREKEAWGEILKYALLDKNLFLSLSKKNAAPWKLLPRLVQIKLKFTQNDLFEKNGRRIKLNLGHTLGHVIEVQNKLPHGIAVAWGLIFALELSHELKMIDDRYYSQALQLLDNYFLKFNLAHPKLKISKIEKVLFNDKKNNSKNKIRFVLPASIGKVKTQNVSISKIEKTLRRLQWI